MLSICLKMAEVVNFSNCTPTFCSNRDRRPSGERHVVQQSSMEVYIKAGPSGEVGDCPFAHFVRCVLNFKGLEYKVRISLCYIRMIN